MSLCKIIQDDILIWPFNPDGVYFFKFRYRYLHEQQQHGLPRPSDNSVLKPLWKKIWGLQVPNKVKHLAWKACKDSLPTKTNLVRRKVLLRAAVMLANCTRRMWFMLCSVAQLCNLFGGLGLNGITARFKRAPLSLIFLSLFL